MPIIQKKNTSSEIFASFLISRIDKKALDSLTPYQLEAIREALLAADQEKRHSIDLRITIPLYFSRYYLVLFAGKDKRKGTLLKEAMRQNKHYTTSGLLMICCVSLLIASALLVVAAMAAYYLKSEMGIDIFPNKHLEDVILEMFR